MGRRITIAMVTFTLAVPTAAAMAEPAEVATTSCGQAAARLASAQQGTVSHLRAVEDHDRLCQSEPAVELERLERLLRGATPGSPAHFRIIEERDRIADNLRR